MKSAAATVYQFFLALWLGGGALYTFALTPAIFRHYGRNQASEIIGVMMPHYFLWTLLCVLGAAAFLVVQWGGAPPRWRAVSAAIVAIALLSQAYVYFGLYPRILAVKAQVATFEADPEAPARREFRALHGKSMGLNLTLLLEGASLLALAPCLRRRESENIR